MDHEKETRYQASTDDIRQMRIQLDKLTGKIGEVDSNVQEIRTAITGNDMGTEGIVGQIAQIWSEQGIIKKRLDALERDESDRRAVERTKQKYMKLAYSAIGALVLILIKFLIDRFVPVLIHP